MNDYNYRYHPTKTKINFHDYPFSLIDLIKIKDVKNNIYIRKILNSLEKEKKEKAKKLNNLKRNDSTVKRKLNYNINLNSSERIDYKKNPYYLNTSNSITLINNSDAIFAEKNNYNINNSYSTINIFNNKNNKDKISDYIIKPYKKKSIIMNPYPYKNKNKIKKIKLDLLTPETNNTNSFTDRVLYRNKNEDDINFLNIKKTFDEIINNKTTHEKKESIIELNNSLISVFEEDKNYNKRYNNHIRYRNMGLYKEKKKIEGKINSRKNILRRSLTPDDIFYIKYKRRLTQILILLLEKYCKIFLLKIKYLFLNNLKNIIKNKRKIKFKLTKRNKGIASIYNFYTTEADKNKKITINKNTFLNNKYNSRNERTLMLRIKKENCNFSHNRLNRTELCRNLSELNKKKEIIERRKKSQSKEKQNEKIRKIKKYLYENKKNNMILNKSSLNILRKGNQNNKNIKNNWLINDYSGKIIIVKKLSTWDKKINIDIKYMDFVNFQNRKKFINLKISKNFCIDLIRHTSNKSILIQRIENRLFNNKNISKSNYKNNLGFIKEEEEKSNN